jgi:hypothetical protein
MQEAERMLSLSRQPGQTNDDFARSEAEHKKMAMSLLGNCREALSRIASLSAESRRNKPENGGRNAD